MADDIKQLISTLRRNPEWTERKEAAQYLGKCRDPRAVKALIAALRRDKERWVRSAAAESLGKLGDPKALKPLLAALKNRNDDVRQGAAKGLGELGDARALEPLIGALRWEWIPYQYAHEQAIKALGKLGDVRAVEPLIAALEGNNRAAVAWSLGELGDARAVEPLVGILEDYLESNRTAAAEALGKLGDPRAAGPLAALRRKKEEERVRQAALTALTKMGEEALVPLLKDRSSTVRESAKQALECLGWSPGTTKVKWPEVDRANPVNQIKWVQDELQWLRYDKRHDDVIQWWKDMAEAMPDLTIVYPGRDFSPEDAKARAWSGLGMIIYYLRNPSDVAFSKPCPEAAFCWEQALALMPGDGYYTDCLKRVSGSK
jgi:HEAT repeat protein